MSETLLDVKNLSVRFAVLAVARLVDAFQGSVQLGDVDLQSLSDEPLRQARADMQIIFQDPYSSLNPRLKAQDIVREPLENMQSVPREEHQGIVDGLFESVGLRAEQKSCDEPVSALDVAVQAQILNLLKKLQQEKELTYLFISHDLGVVQHMCDSIAVMYMGKIVEQADRLSLFNNPQHPYTQALLSAVPSVDRNRRSTKRRILIPGDIPDALSVSKGCRFASRCPNVIDICRQSQPELKTHPNKQGASEQRATEHRVTEHRVACHRVDAIESAASNSQ